jgi:hypothetical protein
MRLALLTIALAIGTSSAEARDLSGRYRLDEGHEAAGRLEISADGRFAYDLTVGALDEAARGRWVKRGEQACLTTEPTPKPPEFKTLTARRDQQSLVLVEGENGRGIPGIDVVLGFDRGDPVTGYTQYYGWSPPREERRRPRWVQLTEPISRTASPRLPLAGRKLRVTIVANDIGMVDFRDACFEAKGDHFVLHRAEGDMKFKRAER